MTPTLAQALSLIAPAYNAAQHERAAERMMKDMKTQYEIRADNPDPAKAEEWAIFTTDYNCHARRIACTTNKNEADAMLMGLESAPDLLAALERLVEALDADVCSANILDMIDSKARAVIARARGKGVE